MILRRQVSGGLRHLAPRNALLLGRSQLAQPDQLVDLFLGNNQSVETWSFAPATARARDIVRKMKAAQTGQRLGCVDFPSRPAITRKTAANKSQNKWPMTVITATMADRNRNMLRDSITRTSGGSQKQRLHRTLFYDMQCTTQV